MSERPTLANEPGDSAEEREKKGRERAAVFGGYGHRVSLHQRRRANTEPRERTAPKQISDAERAYRQQKSAGLLPGQSHNAAVEVARKKTMGSGGSHIGAGESVRLNRKAKAAYYNANPRQKEYDALKAEWDKTWTDTKGSKKRRVLEARMNTIAAKQREEDPSKAVSMPTWEE